jgi:redox-sensing transcriptional repressor
MARVDNIPTRTVRRLSLYLRQLETFHHSDRRTISSKELGAALNLSDAQVRKDLAYFGQFGHPGIGYRVAELIHRVRRILGTDKVSNVLLVGVGNLGRALLAFRGFDQRGFEIVAAFDNDPAKIGLPVNSPHPVHIQPVSEMSETIAARSIRVADMMVGAGIRGILNFAPVRIQVDPEVAVSSVDLAVQLEQLSFQLNGAVA